MSSGNLLGRFRNSVGMQVLAALFSAACFFLFYWQGGKAGDCKPHEVDGQCGMSSAVGFVFGLFGGVVILLVSAVAIWVFATRRAETREEESKS